MKWHFLSLLGILLLVGNLHAARVALLSTCGGEAGADVLALAEAKLSQQPDIELVERREVERVLQEQKLTHCGLSEAQQAVTAGRFLGVQVFAALETVPGEREALGLVVFDADTGVVLEDTVVPAAGVEKTAEAILANVEIGCQKRGRPPGTLTTLCMVSMRNIDLPHEFDSWCEAIGLLLSRRLVEAPDLAVLDRKHLESINRERELPGKTTLPALPGSLVLMELEVIRGKGEAVSATVTLKDGSGHEIGRARAVSSTYDAAALAQGLLNDMTTLLKVSKLSAAPDLEREAEQFVREAEFLQGQDDAGGALRFGEAALALSPQNRTLRRRVAEIYSGTAKPHSRPIPIAMELALARIGRSLELSLQAQEQALAETGRPEGDAPSCNWFLYWSALLADAQQASPQVKQKVAEVQQQLRALEVEILFRDMLQQASDSAIGADPTVALDNRLREIDKYGLAPDVWDEVILDGFPVWLRAMEQDPFQMGWVRRSSRLLARLCCLARGSARSSFPHLDGWEWPAQQSAKLRPLFQQMQQHCDPGIRNYGLIGELALDAHLNTVSPAEQKRRFQSIRQQLRNELIQPSREPAEIYRDVACGAELDLIDLLITDPVARRQEYGDLFAFVLGQKYQADWVIRVMTDPKAHIFRQYYPVLNGATYSNIGDDVFPKESIGWQEADYPALLANAQRALGMFKSLDVEMSRWLRPIYAARPDLGPNHQWQQARLLFDCEGQECKALQVVSVQNDAALILVHTREDTLRLIRVPFDGQTPSRLPPSIRCRSDISCTAEYQGTVYAGTSGFAGKPGDGICMLPLENKPATAVSLTNGLPSSNVQAIACVDGKLYAALDGGYLIVRDLATGEMNTLVSNRRKEKINPLDETSLLVPSMFGDPARHRVLFLLSGGQCSPMVGLWQIDARRDGFRQLVQFNRAPDWMGRLPGGQFLISYGQCYGGDDDSCTGPRRAVVKVDPATDQARIIYAFNGGSQLAGAQLFCTKNTLAMPLMTQAPLALVDGWLWHKDGRLPPNGTVSEDYPPLTRLGKTCQPIWKFFEPLHDEHTVLAADDWTLWLLTSSEKPAKGTL